MPTQYDDPNEDDDIKAVQQYVADSAVRHGVNPALALETFRHESANWNKDVIFGKRTSPKGAIGTAQLMPGTAKSLGVDPHDVPSNIDGGMQLLRQHLDDFGNTEDALRAYNAGAGAVEKSRHYSETNTYVKKIAEGIAQRYPELDFNSLHQKYDAGTTNESSMTNADANTVQYQPPAKPQKAVQKGASAVQKPQTQFVYHQQPSAVPQSDAAAVADYLKRKQMDMNSQPQTTDWSVARKDFITGMKRPEQGLWQHAADEMTNKIGAKNRPLPKAAPQSFGNVDVNTGKVSAPINPADVQDFGRTAKQASGITPAVEMALAAPGAIKQGLGQVAAAFDPIELLKNTLNRMQDTVSPEEQQRRQQNPNEPSIAPVNTTLFGNALNMVRSGLEHYAPGLGLLNTPEGIKTTAPEEFIASARSSATAGIADYGHVDPNRFNSPQEEQNAQIAGYLGDVTAGVIPYTIAGKAIAGTRLGQIVNDLRGGNLAQRVLGRVAGDVATFGAVDTAREAGDYLNNRKDFSLNSLMESAKNIGKGAATGVGFGIGGAIGDELAGGVNRFRTNREVGKVYGGETPEVRSGIADDYQRLGIVKPGLAESIAATIPTVGGAAAARYLTGQPNTLQSLVSDTVFSNLHERPSPDRFAATTEASRNAAAEANAAARGESRGELSPFNRIQGNIDATRIASNINGVPEDRLTGTKEMMETAPETKAPLPPVDKKYLSKSAADSNTIADKVTKLTSEQGGATYNPTKGDLGNTDNYAVSLYPERSMVLDGNMAQSDPEQFKQNIKNFVDQNQDLLRDSRHSVGTWYDEKSGKTYVDVSVTVPDRNNAEALGSFYNQKAIFDLKKFEEIPTGGTGEPVEGTPDVPNRMSHFDTLQQSNQRESSFTAADQREPTKADTLDKYLRQKYGKVPPRQVTGRHWLLADGTVTGSVGDHPRSAADALNQIGIKADYGNARESMTGINGAIRVVVDRRGLGVEIPKGQLTVEQQDQISKMVQENKGRDFRWAVYDPKNTSAVEHGSDFTSLRNTDEWENSAFQSDRFYSQKEKKEGVKITSDGTIAPVPNETTAKIVKYAGKDPAKFQEIFDEAQKGNRIVVADSAIAKAAYDNPVVLYYAPFSMTDATLKAAAKVFNKRSNMALGKLPGKADTNTKLERIQFGNFMSELKYQLAQENSGQLWYKDDIAKLEKGLKVMFPELEDPNQMKLFKAILALTSNGNNPKTNTGAAIRMWEEYSKNGFTELPLKQPITGKGYILRGEELATKINTLNELIKERGVKGTVDFLNSKHSRAELVRVRDSLGVEDYNPEYFKTTGEAKSSMSQYASDRGWGSNIFGAKLGSFYQNLNGNANELTMDLWFSRTWNRWMGTMFNSDGVLIGAPRSDGERRAMLAGVEMLQNDINSQVNPKTGKNYDLTTSEIQALLWYYEQQLWKSHGVKVDSYSYADGITNELVYKGVRSDKQDAQKYFDAAAEVQPDRVGEYSKENLARWKKSLINDYGIQLGKGESSIPQSVAETRLNPERVRELYQAERDEQDRKAAELDRAAEQKLLDKQQRQPLNKREQNKLTSLQQKRLRLAGGEGENWQETNRNGIVAREQQTGEAATLDPNTGKIADQKPEEAPRTIHHQQFGDVVPTGNSSGNTIEVRDADGNLHNILPVTQNNSAVYRSKEDLKKVFADTVVKDSKGNPLPVYHATTGDFDTFESRPGSHLGFHFGTDKAAQSIVNYKANWNANNTPEGMNMQKNYLLLKNPAEVPDIGTWNEADSVMKAVRKYLTPEQRADVGKDIQSIYDNRSSTSEDWTNANHEVIEKIKQYLKSNGYDGLKYKNIYEDAGSTSYAVFDSNQIKSVNNRGTFDTGTGNIMEQKEPMVRNSTIDSVESVVNGMDFRVRQAKPVPGRAASAAPTIYTNDHAQFWLDAIRTPEGEPVYRTGGMAVPVTEIPKLLEYSRATAQNFVDKGIITQEQATENIGKFEDAIRRAVAERPNASSIVFAKSGEYTQLSSIKSTLRHERFHADQFTYSNYEHFPLSRLYLTAARSRAQRAMTTAIESLSRNGYDPSHMSSEIGAHLASGEEGWKLLFNKEQDAGKRRQMAKQLMKAYVDTMINEHQLTEENFDKQWGYVDKSLRDTYKQVFADRQANAETSALADKFIKGLGDFNGTKTQNGTGSIKAVGESESDRQFRQAVRLSLPGASEVERAAQAGAEDIARSKTSRDKFTQTLLTLRKAGMLTGVHTALKNIGSNATSLALEEIAKIPAAIVDTITGTFTGNRTVTTPHLSDMFSALNDVRKNMGSEIARAMQSKESGYAPDGWKSVFEAANKDQQSSGKEREKYDAPKEVNTGNKLIDHYINWVFNWQTAQDRVFRIYGVKRSLDMQAETMAMTEAKQKLIDTSDVPERTKEILRGENITDELKARMAAAAIADAEYALFQSYNPVMAGVEKFTGNVEEYLNKQIPKSGDMVRYAIDTLMPFRKTPANVAGRVIAYSPAGFAKSAYKLSAMQQRRAELAANRQKLADMREPTTKGEPIKGSMSEAVYKGELKNYRDYHAAREAVQESLFANRQAQKEFSMSVGRATLGSGMIVLGYLGAAKGIFTGFASDDKKRNQIELSGASEGAVKVKGKWLKISDYSPAGMLMSVGANIYDQTHKKAENFSQFAGNVRTVATKMILDHPLAGAMKTTVDALGSPGTATKSDWGKAGANMVGSAIPAAVKDVTRTIDPYQKAPVDSEQQLLKDVPVLSKKVPNKKDVLGREVDKAYPFDPFATRTEKTDPVSQELVKHNVGLSSTAKVPTDTPQQAERRKAERATALNTTLSGLVNSKRYQDSSDADKQFSLEAVAKRASDSKVDFKNAPLLEADSGRVVHNAKIAESQKNTLAEIKKGDDYQTLSKKQRDAVDKAVQSVFDDYRINYEAGMSPKNINNIVDRESQRFQRDLQSGKIQKYIDREIKYAKKDYKY